MARVPAQGLRMHGAITSFDFSPSIGILARDIDKLGLDIRSFREPLKRSIQQVMIPSFRENFQTGGRPEPWEPLAEYTQVLREKAGKNGEGPILVRSGSLMRNMGFMSIWTITTNFATIKDLPQRIWYGKLHQGGLGTFSGVVAKHGGNIKEALAATGTGSEKKANIPQRQFVLIQPEDAKAIEYVFSLWLGERVAKAKFKVGV